MASLKKNNHNVSLLISAEKVKERDGSTRHKPSPPNFPYLPVSRRTRARNLDKFETLLHSDNEQKTVSLKP